MKCNKCLQEFEDCQIGSILFFHEHKCLCGNCSRWYRRSLNAYEALFTAAFLEPKDETIQAWRNFQPERLNEEAPQGDAKV